jgi:hypothetical protein
MKRKIKIKVDHRRTIKNRKRDQADGRYNRQNERTQENTNLTTEDKMRENGTVQKNLEMDILTKSAKHIV